MLIIKEKLNPSTGYTRVLKRLVVDQDCLILDISERRKVSGAASKLKSQGMFFITRKAGDKVKVQRINRPDQPTETELQIA